MAIIWSRSDPWLGGEQGCVVDAHHPWYSLHIRDGSVRRVNANRDVLRPGFRETEEEARLCSRLEKEGRLGSFGVHMDTQLKSLRRIVEEKQYAKAVKADDAVIPVHLWDDRVPLPEASKAKSLLLLRQIGHKLFLRALRRDSVRFMRSTHGREWSKLPKKNERGQVTEVARDQQAICSMLWHATQTNWFEYKCGSRLVHFRFPLRYRKLAQDGVLVFFESTCPTGKCLQPEIKDQAKRAQVQAKLEKVLGRRYMLTTGLTIKSLIKYFAVDKEGVQ